MTKLILEGGAAVNGRRILQSEVPSIIDKVDEILSGLGLVKGEDWDMVGSAGKKKAEDTSGDIDNVIALANAAGASAKVLGELAKVKSIFSAVESGSAAGLSFLNNGQFEEAQAILESIENGTYDFEFSIDPNKFKYSGGNKSNSSSSGSGSKSSEKVYDWTEQALKRISAENDKIREQVDDTNLSYDERLSLQKIVMQ